MRRLGAHASAALRVAGCVSALGIGACYSPTLPLPPPNQPTDLLVSDDRTTIIMGGSGAIPGALVFILNDDVGQGQFGTAGPHGEYRITVPLDLSMYDQNSFVIWQRSGIRDSEPWRFRAPPRYGPGSLGWPPSDAGDGATAGASDAGSVDAGGAPADADVDAN